ncbi:MAG: hypothetical protein QOI38_616, partial [Sphingomonadales bacterium]|nr:hypothetical protein [Sphingomonadales bacterium]
MTRRAAFVLALLLAAAVALSLALP